MRIFHVVFVFTLLLSNQSIAQKLKVDSLFQEFKEDVQIELDHNGFTFYPDTRISFLIFLDNASINDLLTYLNDSNPIVRSYIFTGLAMKNANEELLNEIYNTFENDTAKFEMMVGWVIETKTVNSHMKEILNSKNRETDFYFKERIIAFKERYGLKYNDFDHNAIKKADLLQLDSLATYDSAYVVQKFEITFGDKTLASSSNKLTQEMKELIKIYQVNDVLVLNRIEAINKENSIRYYGKKFLKVR